jgi:tetratricopeptide (TPR) repeat protein
LVRRLRELRTWAGISEREIHRRVKRLRTAHGIPELPAFDTVSRCFRPGRKRLDPDLVVDIATVLLEDEARTVGWRQALQLIASREVDATVVATFDRLPASPAVFSGRSAELRLLDHFASADTTPVVISVEGMPGVGKTTLVQRFAHRMAARSTGLVLWADLRGYDLELPPADPAAVLDGFLRHLGVSANRSRILDLAGRSREYRECLRGRYAVVVLDNAATEGQVLPLLSDSPGCLTLITSRRTLRGLRGAHHLALDVFTPQEAFDFLRRTIGASRVEAESDNAAKIAEMMGYLPLTLGLAASRITATSGWTLADHLQRLTVRKEGMRLDDRLETELARSYVALSVGQQRMFRLLALHPGRDVEAFAAAALADTDLDTAKRHLDILVVRNLLQHHVPGRFRFHDLLRVYAMNQTIDSDPASSQHQARIRLLHHYRHAVASAMARYAPYEHRRHPTVPDPGTPAPTFSDRETATAWLDAERSNLAAVSGYAAHHHWYEYCADLSELLSHYLESGSHYRDAESLHSYASLSPSPRSKAHALRRVSIMQWKMGCYSTALGQLRRALTTFRETGDRIGEGMTLNNLGSVYRRMGRYQEALDCYPPAITIAMETDDRDAEANARNCLGILYHRLCRHGEAVDQHQQAMNMFRDIGNYAGNGRVLSDLGDVYRHIGRYEEALSCYPKAMIIARDIGDRVGVGLALARVGLLYARLERHADALHTLQQAQCIAEETGDCAIKLETLNGFGVTLRSVGSFERAIEHHREALDMATDLDARYEQAQAHDEIAHTYRNLGETRAARTHRELALKLYSELKTLRRKSWDGEF